MKIFTLIFLTILCCHSATRAQLKPFYSAAQSKYGYKNTKGQEIVAPKYELAYDFIEGRAAVKSKGKYGYLDESGKEIIPLKYDFTWHFIGGFAAVKRLDKYGFVDKEGKEVVQPIYEDANNYHGNCCYKGMAHVKQDGTWKIIQLVEEKSK